MSRENASKRKKAVLPMTGGSAIKAQKERKKYAQDPTMRAAPENIEALKRLRDCLEIKHKKDMEELHINDLSIDDALTYILIGYARRHQEIAELLNIDSTMARILSYSGCE